MSILQLKFWLEDDDNEGGDLEFIGGASMCECFRFNGNNGASNAVPCRDGLTQK